jgi:putative tryptophan/tyrosine transport system substrate-binding protein
MRFHRLKRREFITLLGGAAAAWPLAAHAQRSAKIPRVGIIDEAPMWDAFRQGLRDLGYVEGQNIAFDYASCRMRRTLPTSIDRRQSCRICRGRRVAR